MTKQSRFPLVIFVFIFLFSTSVQADIAPGTICIIKLGEIAMPPDSLEVIYKVEGYSSFFVQSIQMGGFFQLQIKGQSGDVLIEVDDVNGIVPIGDEKYVYAVSSTYGNRPGLYLFKAATKKVIILRRAENVVEGYSNGADYFELLKYDKEKQVIFFYFSPEPNKIDFSKFRTPENLRNLDLNEFKNEQFR